MNVKHVRRPRVRRPHHILDIYDPDEMFLHEKPVANNNKHEHVTFRYYRNIFFGGFISLVLAAVVFVLLLHSSLSSTERGHTALRGEFRHGTSPPPSPQISQSQVTFYDGNRVVSTSIFALCVCVCVCVSSG